MHSISNQLVLVGVSQKTALDLIDLKSEQISERGDEACGQYFEGERSIDLWSFCIEAQGDLAALRFRVENGIALEQDQMRMLKNIADSSALKEASENNTNL